jgi:hypothetical protein
VKTQAAQQETSGVRTKFFRNRKMNPQQTVNKVCSDPAWMVNQYPHDGTAHKGKRRHFPFRFCGAGGSVSVV